MDRLYELLWITWKLRTQLHGIFNRTYSSHYITRKAPELYSKTSKRSKTYPYVIRSMHRSNVYMYTYFILLRCSFSIFSSLSTSLSFVWFVKFVAPFLKEISWHFNFYQSLLLHENTNFTKRKKIHWNHSHIIVWTWNI